MVMSDRRNFHRTARSKRILDCFERFMLARREFLAVAEQCACKGWPDYSVAVRAATRLQYLFCDLEVSRLKYVLATASDEVLKAYGKISSIRPRLVEKWAESDENRLRREDLSYVELQEEIQKTRSQDEKALLEEPFEMAKKDPELIAAGHEFSQKWRLIDSELEAISKS
jgi:hypothetical protein